MDLKDALYGLHLFCCDLCLGGRMISMDLDEVLCENVD
jgi:hypothetical protein